MKDLILITRLYFHFGPIMTKGQVTLTTDAGWTLEVDEFINLKTGSKVIELPDQTQLYVEHHQTCSVSLHHYSRQELPSMGKVTFKEVKLSATSKAPCAVCGKSATRSRQFHQTLNPFNKNPDGSLKTAEQIKVELAADIAAWKLGPLTHARCE